jgi:Flp pilus assembly protein TadG
MHSIGFGENASHQKGGTLGALALCNAGGILSTFALATPVLLMAVAAAVDYGTFERGRSRLQAGVDAAAIAAARDAVGANQYDEDSGGR